MEECIEGYNDVDDDSEKFSAEFDPIEFMECREFNFEDSYAR